MLNKAVLSFLLLFSLSGFSQNRDTLTFRLKSPYLSLRTFTDNLDEDRRNLDAASILFNASSEEEINKIEYVKKFEQILDGAGILIFFDDVPSNPDFYDSLAQEHRYVISKKYPEIYLQKVNNRWQFQPYAMKQIDRVHHDLFRFGSFFLLNEKAKSGFLGERTMGLENWQWLGILSLILIGFLIRSFFAFFFGRLIMRLLSQMGKQHVGNKYILPVAKPTGMLVVFFFIAVFYPVLQLSPSVSYYVVMFLKGIIPLFGVMICYRMVNIIEVFMTKMAERTENTLDDQLVPLVKKILKVIIILLGGLVILDSLSVPILPLLTGLSIGGLAFALAAQDTIKNFFGSLMIFIDKPFQIGDWITSGEIDGSVEEVGFRSTRIRTFRNSVTYVPNGKLADAVIDNHGLRLFRRFKMSIAIKYDTPPDRIEVFVEGLRKIVLKHPKTNKNNFEIHLNEMNTSSLTVMFYIFFEAPNWSSELTFRQQIILDILRLGEKLSVLFAFPTQTINVENLPGQNSLSPVYTLTKEDLNKRLKEYFDEHEKA